MRCPNTQCIVEEVNVEEISQDTYRIDYAIVVASCPICISCGCDLVNEGIAPVIDNYLKSLFWRGN